MCFHIHNQDHVQSYALRHIVVGKADNHQFHIQPMTLERLFPTVQQQSKTKVQLCLCHR
jgi:hypothetical protein